MREKKHIKSLSFEEFSVLASDLGMPKFLPEQVYRWIYKHNAQFSHMTNISNQNKQILEDNFYIYSLKIQKRLVSNRDNTVKYLLELPDSEVVESVLMRYNYGSSICISTQVGCRMGCAFCASTITGKVRDLTAGEMIDQIMTVEDDLGEKIKNVVLMGIGEPLDNFENLIKFFEIVSSPKCMNKSLRNISLSTCGLSDKIYDLAEYRLGITLSVSLHAPNDRIRNQLMPVNRAFPTDELIKACKYYFNKTRRRISFEYAMIEGVNDSLESAAELALLLKGFSCHVNLIPINYVRETGFKPSSKNVINAFKQYLESRNINVTIRRQLGSDINASCGQLRRNSLVEGGVLIDNQQ